VAEIRIDDLTASYDDHPVLVAVSLVVAPGTLTCVLGSSGCGKTTLLRVVAGFTPACAGTVRIGDRVVDDGRARVAPERRRVGYVSQEGALFPHLTVADNVGFALRRSSRGDRRARRESVEEMLALVGLPEVADRYPHQLSGGQQQRVAVARALASRPDIVLLDEPFASLDAELRARLRADIRQVLRSCGVTAILVTHDRAEALSLADQIAVIHRGRIVQAGTPSQLYRMPTNDYVAAFVGDVNVLPAAIVDGRASTALGVFDLEPFSPTTRGVARVVVRPEHIRLRPLGTCGDGQDLPVGIVTRVEYFGAESRMEVSMRAQGATERVVVRMAGEHLPREGASVHVEVVGSVWALP